MFDRPARIAVVSPSGISQTDRLDAGLACLRAWGHEPTLLPHARSQHRYLAGTDAERLAVLAAHLRDPEVTDLDDVVEREKDVVRLQVEVLQLFDKKRIF